MFHRKSCDRQSLRVHCITMYSTTNVCIVPSLVRLVVCYKITQNYIKIGVFLLLYIPHTKPPHRVRPHARMSSGPNGPVAAVQLGKLDLMTRGPI